MLIHLTTGVSTRRCYMEFALGFFICLSVVLVIDRFRKPNQEEVKATEEELKKQKEVEEHYQNMINYDYKQALGGDKRAN